MVSLVKKPKIAQAKVASAPKLQNANGSITAPKSAANRIGPGVSLSKKGKTASNAGASSGAGASTGSSSSVATPAPESPATLVGRSTADEKWSIAQKTDAWKRYQAALAYGDPALIKQYGDAYASAAGTPVAEPTEMGGSLLNISNEEAANQKQNTLTHGNNNTFRSGFNLVDIQNIANEANAAKAEALKNLENALVELREAESESKAEWETAHREAEEEDIGSDLEGEPVPEDTGSSSGSSKGSGTTKKKKNSIGNANALRKGQGISKARKA